MFHTFLAQVTEPRGRRPGRGADARQRDPRRAVLLLDRRPDVAHPRGLHDLRGRCGASQERDGHGDEEHPHDRRGHADLLLLRLVDLQLQPARPADRPELERLHRRRLPGRHPVERRLRAEPHEQHQPHLLPGVPAVLVDDGLDHVGRAARARAAVRVPGPGGDPRLGRMDPRRGLGLERRRLDDAALRVPRLDRLGRRARRGGSLHARGAVPPRAAHRQVHEGGAGTPLPAEQPAHHAARADAHLHRLLRLLRGLSRDRVHVLPGLGDRSTSARPRSARSAW